jgi:RNA polymerase sigma-70 factor, ECF subfamily
MNAATMTDAEIVARVLGGDAGAFERLVERYERLMFSYLLPQVRHTQEVEDIAQETFLKAFRHLRTFDPARRFSAWLLRIARNVMFDTQKTRRQTVPAGDALTDLLNDRAAPSEQANPDDRLQNLEAFRQTFVQVLQLPEDLRIPLMLRVLEDQTYEEIADLLELPLQTVKNRIFKARRALREKRSGTRDVSA